MINHLTEDLEKAVEALVKSSKLAEKEIYSGILLELKDLSLYSGGSIKNNLENIKKIGRIKKLLNEIILTDDYLKSVGEFAEVYTTTEKTLNTYFSTLNKEFTPKKVLAEVKKQAIADTVDMLTESGITANVAAPIQGILKTNITAGGSYADLTEQLRKQILSTPEIEGSLAKYSRTYATDAANTYAGSYMKVVTDDLGLKWYRVVGALIRTSRQICKEMIAKKFLHQSEFADMLKGHVNGKQLTLGKNGFPLGLKANTTVDNYQQLRNGWECSHQFIPMSEIAVPKDVRIEVYTRKGIKFNDEGMAKG